MDLAELTLQMFEPLVGEAFALGGFDAGQIELVLSAATTLGPRPGGRDPFALVLRGPREPLLAQATYALSTEALGTLEIFLVPVAQDADGATYEAIFT